MSVQIDRVTRAVDTDGREWVPAEEFDRLVARLEVLRAMTVNPRRNISRALNAVGDGGSPPSLDVARSQMDALYAEAHRA